jgi:hypothetical protein
MWRSKKFIVSAVLAVIVLAASIGGVALATDEENGNESVAPFDTLWEKMATVLQEDGIDITSDQLKSAFTEAQEQMRTDALQNFLDEMVAQEKITREQADAYLDWIEAKPDMGDEFGFRGLGGFSGMGGKRFEFRMRGPGGFHGFGGFCPQADETQEEATN